MSGQNVPEKLDKQCWTGQNERIYICRDKLLQGTGGDPVRNIMGNMLGAGKQNERQNERRHSGTQSGRQSHVHAGQNVRNSETEGGRK